MFVESALKEVSVFDIWRSMKELDPELLGPARVNFIKLLDSMVYAKAEIEGLTLVGVTSILRSIREDLPSVLDSVDRNKLEYSIVLQQILAMLEFIFAGETSRLTASATDAMPLADELFSTPPNSI
jgi:hypothetical protein